MTEQLTLPPFRGWVGFVKCIVTLVAVWWHSLGGIDHGPRCLGKQCRNAYEKE